MRINYFNKPITKRFIDAFPKFERTDPEDEEKYFWETWTESPFFTDKFTKDEIESIYHHLMAEYYNWHFIYMDDLGISLNIMHIIEEYYPNVKCRLDLVEQMRDLSLDEFKKSGIEISSNGANPKIATDMDELIDLVDSQTANFQLKSTEQVLKAKFLSLYDGVMDQFIKRFKPLFVKLYSGLSDYVYINEKEVEEDE